MGFYIRKSLSVGPFRFNLSKSGVGVSAGVKGFRVGAGPRGNYVHMGRGGVYFRQTLPGSNGGRQPSESPVGVSSNIEFTDIESSSVGQMIDSSSSALLAEINQKLRKPRIWPWIAAAGILLMSLLAAGNSPTWA